MALPRKVIFCLPGKTFSDNYFNAWNLSIAELSKLGIEFGYSMHYDPVVYYTRNKILGGSNQKGPKQTPWQSTVQYDTMIWIDSDIIWTVDNLLNILNHEYPIVAGSYLMSDRIHYPIVETLDYNLLRNTGEFKFLDKTEMAKRIQPFKVSYTGFGFIAIKYGVFENMDYPWFQPRWISNESFHDFSSEDVGFCWNAYDKGYEIYIDPNIIVKHEKTILI